MANDEKEVLDETPEAPEEVKEGEEDNTDWKALAQRNAGIAKRNATRLAKMKTAANAKVETPAEKVIQTKKGFDYAEKAFLKSNGISADEYEFVQEVMQGTGKSLDDVLESKYFQAELKEKRDLKASKDAIPSGSKRASPTTRDSVEYWLAKGELPPRDQSELRSKVVKAKIAAAKKGSQFSDNPIV